MTIYKEYEIRPYRVLRGIALPIPLSWPCGGPVNWGGAICLRMVDVTWRATTTRLEQRSLACSEKARGLEGLLA